jgi:hypothetical protein
MSINTEKKLTTPVVHFTMGLLIGDGSFQINHWKRKYLQYRITIKLKNTDANLEMLRSLNRLWNLGTFQVLKKEVKWTISDKKQLLQFIKIIDSNRCLILKRSTYLKIQKIRYSIQHKLSFQTYYHYEANHHLWNNLITLEPNEQYELSDSKW